MEPERAELLVRLLSKHQEELFRYIFALLPHEEGARDVLQETSVALCRKFADYDPRKPFLAWAYRFAYLEILKHRERSQRRARLLSPELIDCLVHSRVAKLALGGKLRFSHLLDEGREVFPCVGLGPRTDAPVERANSSVVPSAQCHAQFPPAASQLAQRAGALAGAPRSRLFRACD